MNKQEMMALLQAAAALNIDGADDALELVTEVSDDLEKLQLHIREIRKILKRMKKRF